MSNYPPGVTGHEPEITGDWPCECGEFCDLVPTDCCEEQPDCEVTQVLDSDGTVNVQVCRTGMGCDRG